MHSAVSMLPRRKTLSLFTLVIALVLEIVDLTIVNTALPAIKSSLGTSAEASQWIVAGYALSFALLLMAGGRLGDSYGYRRMFILGVLGFTFLGNQIPFIKNKSQELLMRLFGYPKELLRIKNN